MSLQPQLLNSNNKNQLTLPCLCRASQPHVCTNCTTSTELLPRASLPHVYTHCYTSTEHLPRVSLPYVSAHYYAITEQHPRASQPHVCAHATPAQSRSHALHCHGCTPTATPPQIHFQARHCIACAPTATLNPKHSIHYRTAHLHIRSRPTLPSCCIPAWTAWHLTWYASSKNSKQSALSLNCSDMALIAHIYDLWGCVIFRLNLVSYG